MLNNFSLSCLCPCFCSPPLPIVYLFIIKNHPYIGWWKFALKNPKFFKHCALIVKLVLNVYRLGNKRCDLCTKMQANTVSHILFSCEYNEDVRQDKWKILSYMQ